MSLRSRCAHRLWQSVLLVLGAGILRIPTTSLRTGLGMTRKFFRLLSLRAGANTGYPARNPSTNLRLVPLPLGKGGKLSLPQLLTGSFAIASDAFPFPRKSAARDPAAAVMRPLKIDPLFPVGRDTPSAPVPPVPLATHGNPPRVSLPLGKGGYLSPYYFVPSPSDFTLRRFG